MNTAQRLQQEFAAIGYSTIERDYVFSDVFAPARRDYTVPLAAFTHSPPSYRNAALAVVEPAHFGFEITEEYRALGAPLLFVIQGQEVTVWQVHSKGRPTIYRRVVLDQLSALFSEHQKIWSPRRIHRAKSLGSLDKSYQLDFVDIGLLPAIEGMIHNKLDRLLTETLAETVRLRIIRAGEQVDDQLVFRTIFRLLAAKVLQDRGDDLAKTWNPTDIDTVLGRISRHYKLPPLPGETSSFRGTPFESAWTRLSGGINFRNISSDDLAFVYENTLVRRETRKHFGTHSTPRAVAEYIVNHLELWRQDLSKLNIYEPFAGAGVFMVAALRHLRDRLPIEMSEVERHRFLVERITGDEIDPFATEVATLSLILADYPNENGWAVSQTDLFKKFALVERGKGANVILCNPPFGAFTYEERLLYPEVYARSTFKPIAALEAVLDARPDAVGFVLPEPFIYGQQYKRQRQRTERLYREIEVVALPDRVFKASVIRSSLLIAREPRVVGDAITNLRSTVVNVGNRDAFLLTGEVTNWRARARPYDRSSGDLWLEELEEVWKYLAGGPILGNVADVHNGLQWKGGQANAVRQYPEEGFSLGIHEANAVHTFVLDEAEYLKCRPETFRRSGEYPWHKSKILANAARLSRGPWCFAAAVDEKGLLASQQLFGIWIKNKTHDLSLVALCALLNNPLAVAYLAAHSPPDRIRVATVEAIPIPAQMPGIIDELVARYTTILGQHTGLFPEKLDEQANKVLAGIDAVILGAYDLPPRLERGLLEYFRGAERPTVHAWTHWFPDEGFNPFIPLHEYLSEEHQRATGSWVLDVFTPLPEEEAVVFRDDLEE